MIYDKINDFCKVRNETQFNKDGISKRSYYLMNLLDELNIDFETHVKRGEDEKLFVNLYAFGDSFKFLCAHHDVINVDSDNANDNSASVINMIAYKKKNPGINLIITDGEEPPFMGIGAKMASDYFKENDISVQWILNLELTGKGKNFFIDKYDTQLSRCIKDKFPNSYCITPPFNDSYIFRENGLQSNVITTIDTHYGKIDYSFLGKSHSLEDRVENMSIDDMKYFTENVIDEIVRKC